jgi:hypothetical protein
MGDGLLHLVHVNNDDVVPSNEHFLEASLSLSMSLPQFLAANLGNSFNADKLTLILSGSDGSDGSNGNN